MEHGHVFTPQPVATEQTRKILLVGLIFVVVLLVALITLPPFLSARTDRLRARVDEAQKFADTLTLTENQMQQLQATTRGYLVTQAPAFLEQYRATQDGLPTTVNNLTHLAPVVDERLVPQVAELTTVVARWQREGGDRQIQLAESGRVADAVRELAAGESQAIFDSFRTRVGDLRSQLQAIQSDLQGTLNQARTLQTTITVILGSLGLLALGFVITGFLRLVRLMRALETARLHTSHLADQVRNQLATAEQRNRQLSMLHDIASASAINMQQEQRAENVLTAIMHALNLTVGALWLFTNETEQWQGVFPNRSVLHTLTPHAQTVLLQSVQSGRLLSLRDTLDAGQLLHDLTGYTTQQDRASYGVILPLRGRTQPIGALVLASIEPEQFRSSELPFFATLATEVGLVLDNARLYGDAQTERQRLQTVFDHSPEGIVVAEAPSGTIVLTNQAATALLGDMRNQAILEQHPLAGRVYVPGGALCPPAELPMVRALQEGLEHRNAELYLEQQDGGRVPILVTSVPLRDEHGCVHGAIAVFQDLRQLHEVERLKSDFVALVSHELRTPLTTIKGCTDTLLRGVALSDSARVREFVQIIDDQGERLQELIDNLLSLSQLEAGALRLRRELVALPPILHGVIRQMRDRLSNLRIQVEAPATLPLVSADPRRIEQVVSNLLDNARKFSPEGGIVTLRAVAHEGTVIVTVADQGPGIPAAEHERVFERFYQVAQPATRQVGGSGLGLAICKSLIEAHGGRIWIDESYRGGTAISFSLLAIPLEEPIPSTNGRNLLAREVVGATHVLVVDDDPALRRILDSGLQDAGYQVRSVVEAQAAIEAVTQHVFDVILLDLMLPGVDGLTLCKQLREWTNVPIIMLTARAAEQDIVRGLQVGADDYVTKPFRMNELIARIEAVLRRSKADVAPGELSLIQTGDLTIDLAQRRVTIADKQVELTPTEYGILVHLARHVGQVLTHEQILKAVWGDDHGDENHYLWVHIAHLRQKIEPDTKAPQYIETERGVGYRLVRV